MAKEKRQWLISPVGEAKWAHVHKPKPPFKDRQDKGAQYQIDVVFDPKDPAWAEWLDGVRQRFSALPEQTDKRTGNKLPKQSPIKNELDQADQPTGRKYFTARTGEQYPPGVFDRFGRPIPPSVLVGNGSKVRISYVENTYDGFGGGINFYLNAVQVMDLVEYGNRGARDYGFAVEEAPADDYAMAGGGGDDGDCPF